MVIPPGSAAGTILSDTLDRGLAFVDCTSLTAASIGLSTSVGTFADVCDNPVVSTEPPGSLDPADLGRAVAFDLGTLTNGDQADATLTLEYDVVVLPAASDSHAFDLVLQDVVPAGLTYVPASLISVGGQVPTTIDDSAAPTLIVSWDTFLDNGVNAVIQFQATLGNIGAGSSVTNSSLLEWSSLPGDISAPQSVYNDLSTERFYDRSE